MDNDLIFGQFDDIEEKVDFFIVLCKSLESTNSDLRKKVEELEQQIENSSLENERQVDTNAMIRTKIDSLLTKLNNYSELS